ncbi:MAG TPA: alpha-glucosidase [Clostridia bacterium]|nr:alpha-glucosidase [Clostridia bacterium]
MTRWWQDRVVYQIYPRSFMDSNGDGIGDIPGIISRLDYLKSLGIGIIWLSPVYSSPNEDNGYDISDYRDINPEYGSMEDMDHLIAEAGKRDIRIIMDLVINHTSSQHEWFIKSREKDSPYRDYYFWRPGKGEKAPNNWTSFFAEDAWEYDEKSGEYYLHLFAKGQPDLNYHNPAVLEEIKDIMRFWLEKGIAGFRCDVINIIWKSSLDDGRKRLALTGMEHYLSQEGNHRILKQLKNEVLSDFDCFTVGETVFVTIETAHDLCDEERGELDMIFSFEHMETDQWFIKWFPRKFKPARFFRTIAGWQRELEWNANYLENHDQPRSVSRFGDDGQYHIKSAKALATLLLTLRGTPYIYQGQEIGMTNYPFKGLEDIRDIESHNLIEMAKKLHIPAWYRKKMLMRGCRDHARTPMQWVPQTGAGFTEGNPWLAINKNHREINAANQLDEEDSILNYYKKLIGIRKASDVLIKGSFREVEIQRDVFVYERKLDEKTIIIAVNLSDKFHTVSLKGRVILSNYGDEIFEGTMRPFEAVVVGEELI